MRRVVAIERGGGGAAGDAVRLDFDRRNRRRMVFTCASGEAILLDEPRPAHLRDGDALRLEDGARVRVEAEPEPLIEIAAPSPAALVRIAWHLGNRHLPTQLVPGADGGALRIRHDHVIADMAAGLGGVCRRLDAPFDPEGGAYAGHDDGRHQAHDPGEHEHEHHRHDHA